MAQSDDIKQLQGDVQSIKDELSDVLASIKATIAQAQEHEGHSAFNPLELLHTLQEKYSYTKEESEKLLEELQALITKNPIKSLAVAAIAGFLLSKLISHKGHR